MAVSFIGEGNRRTRRKPVASHWQTLSHNGVLLAPIEIRTHNISGIGTNRVGSCKSNYHTITATTGPQMFWDILTKYFTTYRITRTKRGWFGSCSFHGFRVLPLFTVDWKRRHSSPMDTLKAEAFQSYGYTESGGIPVLWIHWKRRHSSPMDSSPMDTFNFTWKMKHIIFFLI